MVKGKTVDRNNIFDSEDDLALCNEVYKRFAAIDNKIRADNYSEPEMVVTLVWKAIGMIDNGGLGYLFEGTFSGDPEFEATFDAIRIIGAEKTHRVLMEITKAFPDHRIPRCIEQRMSDYYSIDENRRKTNNDQLWDASENEVIARLAGYIRDNREILEEL